MNHNERMEKIFDNYIGHKFLMLEGEEEIFLGNKENRVCRFCKKSEIETTFEKRAHAIPEFVNNHILFSYYECDKCNQRFAKTIETHMGDYMNAHHTMSQVRGKNGVPSVRKGGEKSKISFNENGLYMESHDDEREIFDFDETNKTFNVNTIRTTYIPIAIHKCLTKMALSLIDESEMIYFENTLEWINEENHDNSRFKIPYLPCFFSFTSGPLPFSKTTCMILKRAESPKENVSYMTFLLAYGNYTFQIAIPLCKNDKGDISMTAIPNIHEFLGIYEKPIYKIIDFSSTKKIKSDPVSIQMSFENLKISEDEN